MTKPEAIDALLKQCEGNTRVTVERDIYELATGEEMPGCDYVDVACDKLVSLKQKKGKDANAELQ